MSQETMNPLELREANEAIERALRGKPYALAEHEVAAADRAGMRLDEFAAFRDNASLPEVEAARDRIAADRKAEVEAEAAARVAAGRQ